MSRLLARKKGDRGAIAFWNNLNYDKRCIFISVLSITLLIEVFKEMAIEDRTTLAMMCKKEIRKQLEDSLTEEERRELFFYKHFTMTEKTDQTAREYID